MNFVWLNFCPYLTVCFHSKHKNMGWIKLIDYKDINDEMVLYKNLFAVRWASPCRLWSSNRDWASHLHWPLPQVLRILYFKNVEIVFFVFSLHFRFCPWLSNGSLTNQITITNLFQAVRNLPRRGRLRSVLEVPRRKTQQVQLPTRTRLWLGTSNTFLFKTECLMSQLSHCLISHRLLLCCLLLGISGLWLVLIVQF